VVVGGAFRTSSNLPPLVGRGVAMRGFAYAASTTPWFVSFVASIGLLAVLVRLSFQRTEEGLGRSVWCNNNFSAGKVRSISGESDCPSIINDILSANLDDSIADRNRAMSVWTLSSEDTIVDPPGNHVAGGASGTGLDSAVEKPGSLHGDAREDCLEGSGKPKTAFGSGSSDQKVGLIESE